MSEIPKFDKRHKPTGSRGEGTLNGKSAHQDTSYLNFWKLKSKKKILKEAR